MSKMLLVSILATSLESHWNVTVFKPFGSYSLFPCFEAVHLRINNKLALIWELRRIILVVRGDGFSYGYYMFRKYVFIYHRIKAVSLLKDALKEKKINPESAMLFQVWFFFFLWIYHILWYMWKLINIVCLYDLVLVFWSRFSISSY